jgi:hypothetical protein
MKCTLWVSALILGTLALAAADASAGQFKRATYLSAGQRPYQVVATHLTKSGNVDLVVADYLSSQIIVLLGNGDGTFQKRMVSNVPLPIGIAVGDLNGDGNEDLLVVESNGTGAGTLAVFLGQGDGKFNFKASYRVGSEAGFVTVADFDGDGRLDVAETDAGNGSGGVLRVFRGTGTGTLLKPTVYKIPDTPGALAAADLNGDHSADLAVTQFSTGSVAVLLNDGTGHFGKPVSYNAGGGEVVDVKIADLRHDGRNDLVIANGSLSAVGVLLNKGNGTFGAVTLYPVCQNYCQAAEAVVIDDFNLDGIPDIAVAGHIGDSSLYYGKGNGTFKPAVRIHNSIGNFQDSGYSIAAGNFITGNKAPDLAIPIEEYGKVAIMINTQ